MVPKILITITDRLYYGCKFSKIINEIMSKKISPKQKINELLIAAQNYVATQIQDEVRFVVFENYYEIFMRDGRKDTKTFQRLFDYEYENLCVGNLSKLSNAITKLYNGSLKDMEMDQICTMLKSFNKDLEDFDLNMFYNNNPYRNWRLMHTQEIMNAISQFKNNQQKSEVANCV